MNKKLTAAVSVILLCVFAAAISFALTSYPYARVYFSGIRMVTNKSKDDVTTQGFVDITLQNINTTGFSFCIEYDDNYVELSDWESNDKILNNALDEDLGEPSTFNIDHKFFKQNTDIFPDGIFRDSQVTQLIGVQMPIVGIANPNKHCFIMNFLPVDDASDYCDYIEEIEQDNRLMQTIISDGDSSLGIEKKDLLLGSISFKIKNPDEFTKLSKTDLENIFKVVSFSNMIANPIVDGKSVESESIHLAYVDDEGDIKMYSSAQHNIGYSFDIEADLEKVEPQVSELAVTSYEVYDSNSIDDLFKLLNERMSMLTMYYSDGSQVPAVFEWDKTKATYTPTAWNPLGGQTYTISQPYKDDADDDEDEIKIEVTVTVNPVTLKGLVYDNEYIAYKKGESDYPANIPMLNLPDKASMVFDTYIPGYGISDFDISWYTTTADGSEVTLDSMPQVFADETVGKYTFIGHLSVDKSDIETNYPWLTVTSIDDIDVIREITADTAQKKIQVDSATVNSSGVLTIVVSNADGSELPSGTTFRIRQPGGAEIDLQALADNDNHYTAVPSETESGKYVITLKPDIDSYNEQGLAKLINLGKRAGSFEISAKEPGGVDSIFEPFSPEARRNLYLAPSDSTTNYEFDYSGLKSALLPVKAVTSLSDLPKTITLPLQSDRIKTTYSGTDGSVPGGLETFTVTEWTLSGDNTGDPTKAGDIVSITGTLADGAVYTNYGKVYNDNGITVTLKYYVIKSDNVDSIEAIPDAEYDKQQVGYDHSRLQTKEFTIKNTGQDTLNGLSVHIDWSDNGVEAFTLTKKPVIMLGKDASETFEITTKHGLDVGKYTSKVTVMSNNKVLQTFNITFEVTDTPIYKITLTVNEDQKDLGSAITETKTYTSEANKKITIIAEPETECEFVSWKVLKGDITDLSDPVKKDDGTYSSTFTMPDSDVEIQAIFKETLAAKLRATELLVKDASDNKDQTLYDKDWKTVKYDPKTREYYVAVPNKTEEVTIWFKPREEVDKKADFSMTHKHGDGDGDTDTLTAPARDDTDDYYKSENIKLVVSPTVNVVTLTMGYDDPADDPDETYVEAEYKINIYRKLDASELFTFNYGNSPYGLIMRDSSIDQAAAKTKFSDSNYTFTAGYTPSGGIEGTHYSKKAWNGANYDLDVTALFVINSSSFIDPGYSTVRNSIGGEVKSSVTRKVTVQRLTETDASLQDGSSDDFVHVEEKEITLTASDSGVIDQLKDERIRPDKYDLVYSFTDFDGETISVKRPLIVLYPLGDVNISGTAETDVDYTRILHRFTTDIANDGNLSSYTTGGPLFRYRICDVNKDECINAIDANNIRAKTYTQFYANFTEGGGG